MTFGVVSWMEINYRAAERAAQDRTARMCRLVLPYTVRNYKSMVANSKKRTDERLLPFALLYICSTRYVIFIVPFKVRPSKWETDISAIILSYKIRYN